MVGGGYYYDMNEKISTSESGEKIEKRVGALSADQISRAMRLAKWFTGDKEWQFARDDDEKKGILYVSWNSLIMQDGRVFVRDTEDGPDGKLPKFEEVKPDDVPPGELSTVEVPEDR